jgi:murein DD-endopeptidase MepM/ murein hydrolase activator NlpD
VVTARPNRTHTLAAAAAAAALGATTAALAADGGGNASDARAARAAASAYLRGDGGGPTYGYVRVSGNGSKSGPGTSVSASTSGGSGRASARATDKSVSLFGGLVTADSVKVGASATGAGASASGTIRDLRIDGARKGTVSSRAVYDLAGYGKLVVLQASDHSITGMRARLSRDYEGNPAGTVVTVSGAAVSARDAVAEPKPEPEPKPQKPESKPDEPDDSRPEEPDKPKAKAKRRKPPRTKALLTDKGFVFPVYGKHTYSNDYGAPRQNTGAHEGNDIFASAGTPVVAVCAGTLHRVGTNVVPGNRMWVRCDKGGDEFFYAHLAAFASDARSGAEVEAGQVVGFVGSTGDAEQTPPHLHFEVHPGGGDPVNPYPFLRAWETRRDVPAAAWVKRNGTGAGQQPGTLVVVRDFLDR